MEKVKNVYPMFNDIIGLDNEIDEIRTIVSILENPQKFNKFGASLPKGIMLNGVPGTGKTLLARALSNELNIPFYLIGADEFGPEDEGMALKNLKSVFDNANKNTPSVIFIDEFNTFIQCTDLNEGNPIIINQLLRYLDGFKENGEVIVVGATNNITNIPTSLLRPGRFDRKIDMGLPDRAACIEAVKNFTAHTTFSNSLTMYRVSDLLSGLTIAEIKHLINEVLISMVMKNEEILTEAHLIESLDRYYLGISKKHDNRTEDELKKIAIHEVSHAIVNNILKDKNDMVRLSVSKRNKISGHFRILRFDLDSTQSATDIKHMISTALAGYTGEIEFYGEPSAGSESDLKKANGLARDMVEKYGMSDLGPRLYKLHERFKFELITSKYGTMIDDNISKIIEECFDKTKEIITSNRKLINYIAEELTKKKVLMNTEFERLIESYKLNNNTQGL